ncbi:uncharacterized protein AKAME5_001017800 [Lates japonicus]|uniref:VWFA domain-containing protein n=1 Tax=Lates japonicus TaxID=270547 RepID=A0AAD3R7R0_LATJO|nr:uncharacterized protein AKAME5_001017800 [Lates japonicus]
MSAIFNLLENHRLQSYYNQFRQLGVKDERDFIDSVTDEDLNTLGLSQVEKNRFSAMKKTIGRFRAPAQPAAASVQKSVRSFSLQYTYPKCPELKFIKDMDPAQNTIEDLMLRICHLESILPAKGVCLYTVDGMPLTDDPFFNTWSLQDRHIKNGDVIYAIFTPKENLNIGRPKSLRQAKETNGTDTVRCHIMLKGDFEVNVDLTKDTITNLKNKLANESGIPAHVLHYKGETGSGNTLESCGISDGTQKIAVVEGLYTLFRELLPQLGSKRGDKIIEDPEVFEYSTHCWAYLIVTGQNFHINTMKTFENMAEEMEAFPLLRVSPPLLLKDLGSQDPCLVFLKEDNLGVYLSKNKLKPAEIQVYNCLSGKTENVDVNELAARTGDQRDDHSFVTTRTPKEAILVLIDTSSSMAKNCYGRVEMQKIHAVKELFDNFATRSMAYDFHHVIGLVTFGTTVTTVHTFTETLEKFKEHVRTLVAHGKTKLYDALHGMLELEKVKSSSRHRLPNSVSQMEMMSDEIPLIY